MPEREHTGGALRSETPLSPFADGRLIRAIGVLGGLQIGTILAQLARTKALALEVGPDGVGIQSIVEQLMILVAAVSTMSLPFASVKFLSFAHSEGERGFVRTYVALRRLLLLCSAVGTAVGVTLALAWPGLFGEEVSRHSTVLVIALLGVPAFNLITLLSSALAAAQRPRAAGALTLAQWAGVAVASGIGVIVADLDGFFLGTTIALVTVTAGGVLYLRRAEGGVELNRRVRVREELRRHPSLLRFAAVQSILIYTTPIAYLTARYIVLGDGGLVEAGLLAAAMAIAQGLSNILRPANAYILTPAMNRNDPVGQKLAQALRFRDTIIVLVCVGALPLILFPETLLSLLFSPRFTEAASYLFLFVLAQCVLMLANVNQALLVGLDDFRSTVLIVLVGQLALVVLALLLVGPMGVAGVGVALLVDASLVLLLTTWRLAARHRMVMFRQLGAFATLALSMLPVLGILAAALPEADAATIAAKLLVAALFAVSGLLVARRLHRSSVEATPAPRT
jgi:O-antigen/teichoic acid export membrane protein